MKTICVFGDSITCGESDFEDGGWVSRLKKYVSEKDRESGLYNLGIPGDSTEDLLERFKIECESREPDIIIFAIGINDTQSVDVAENPRADLEDFRKNLVKLLKQAKEFTSKIVFVGLTNVEESKMGPTNLDPIRYYINGKISLYNAEIKDFSKKNNILFIDLFNLLKNEDLADGLHPNTKGHEKMFDIIKSSLIKDKVL